MANVIKKSKKASSSDALLGDTTEQKTFILTKDGYDKLVSELDYLRNVKRREVADRIREAISYGDLSENSEYEDAKNEQAFVEGRIMELEEKIKFVQIIDESGKKTASVQLGSTVVVKILGAKSSGEAMSFTIVGSTEADPIKGKISNVSPVGIALLDHRAGEKLDVHTPSGVIQYEILKVE
ncbi:MAG: transcription elongation factor GreA [Candidatus Gracilibacteria bacterium]|nr:transcription elongation factor GreA [Candidatus Gracilibacteria bacterium]